MNRRVLIASGAILSAATLALTACNSNDSSDKGSGDELTVFTFSPKNTAIMSYDTETVIKAYADKVNKEGGIKGHKIKVVSCNEKADPNQAAICARQAVSEKATAVVGGFTTNGEQPMKIFEQAGIASLGNMALSQAELTSKFSYPIVAAPIDNVAIGQIAADTCDTTAIVIYDIPAAAVMPTVIGQQLAKKGKKAHTIKVPPTTTDFSSIARQIGDYDCTSTGLPSSAVAPLVASAASLGAKTRYLSSVGTFDQKLLDQYTKQLEGTKVVSTFLLSTNPAWKAATDAVGGAADMTNAILQNSWVSMLVFQKVVEGMSGPVNAQTFNEALSKASNIDTGGLTATLDFTKELPVPGMPRIFDTSRVIFDVKQGQLTQEGGFVDLRQATIG